MNVEAVTQRVRENRGEILQCRPAPAELAAGWKALRLYGAPTDEAVRDFVAARAICPELQTATLSA